MEDKLRLNSSLFSFEGVIGRRDFFLNGVIIYAIELFFTVPYLVFTCTHAESVFDIFNLQKVFFIAPLYLKIWVLAGIALGCMLVASNIYRRLNDINGEVNNFANISCSLIYTVTAISSILSFLLNSVFGLLNFILFLILLFKKGEVTSKFPYDFTKEFNWGAFLGTWIWGLCNKSYKTLWMFLLWFTPWNTYFALYCGLKGNEWAYKNKKCTDVEKFNESQKKQSTIFAIIMLAVVPVLYLLLVFAIVFVIILAGIAASDGSTTEGGVNKTESTIEKIDSFMESMASLYFTKYEILDDENKFYMDGKEWQRSQFRTKKDILDLAASVSAEKRRKADREKDINKYSYYSKTKELPRTKIYDNETGKLLGEFVMDEELMQSSKPMEIMKAAFKAYRFYNL